MKRYAIVLLGALVGALVLGSVARAPRMEATRPEAQEAVPVDSLTIAFEGGSAHPEVASVAVGRRLALTLVNEGAREISVGLAGYEDRVPPGPLAPGTARTVVFHADRPGEAFAFLVDGEPCGRLAVTGSHLGEGRR